MIRSPARAAVRSRAPPASRPPHEGRTRTTLWSPIATGTSRPTRTRSSSLAGAGWSSPAVASCSTTSSPTLISTPASPARRTRTSAPAASGRVRACRRRSSCATGGRSSPPERREARRSSRRCCGSWSTGSTSACRSRRRSPPRERRSATAATTQAEPAFIAQPTTPGLEALGQSFAVSTTSPLDPTITIPPTIGTATGLRVPDAPSDPRRRRAGSARRRGGRRACAPLIGAPGERLSCRVGCRPDGDLLRPHRTRPGSA